MKAGVSYLVARHRGQLESYRVAKIIARGFVKRSTWA